ncbi:hypothetical protein [Streptomyces sp. BBFR109]|uniref:hypothetical protein n=1 Tax=Streptomyces sp. BBFR109 TaxID=3448172 RepID=UPI003F757C39
MQPTILGGPAEVAINGITIPPEMLSEVKTEFVMGTRERKTLGGTFSRPSNILDKAEASFTLFLPNMDYLKNIFPERYNAPTAPQTKGNVIINTSTSVTTEGGPVNIHYSGEDTDDNDVFMYNAQVVLNFSATYNAEDDLSVEVMLLAQPDVDGNVARMGTGDLTAVSHFDAATGETVENA